MYCSNCGKEVRDTARFCRYCGANLLEDEILRPEEPAMDALVVAHADDDGTDNEKPRESQVGFVISRVIIFIVAVLLLFGLMQLLRDRAGRRSGSENAVASYVQPA